MKEEFDRVALKAKILKGLDLAFERLILKKKRENGMLVFSVNGKIEKIRVRDM